ncbi:hypothetical protein L3X38_022266 [Prunus dulcis]|uniref:RNase H type-1 domain-containing protein n=1 Tax=Prunus dulcis TaxID=3755 RepID=A0AAD4Z509_PRUDU|nr:hypothetical protein L3X38_022266 [Prunus dulcis]
MTRLAEETEISPSWPREINGAAMGCHKRARWRRRSTMKTARRRHKNNELTEERVVVKIIYSYNKSFSQDAIGAWLKGYSMNLGIGSVLEAELWDIFWGLSLAWDSGFRTVEVESDSKFAVTLLNTLAISTHSLFIIINCCKLKMSTDWNYSIRHIFREQSCAADALATKSFDFNPGLHIFDGVPACITDILAADTRGDSRPRLL